MADLDDARGDDDVALEGLETVVLRVEFDLIPEWSTVLERIARHHGTRVAVGVEGQTLVVKTAIAPDLKEKFIADVGRYWDQFVERRKREGRWRE